MKDKKNLHIFSVKKPYTGQDIIPKFIWYFSPLQELCPKMFKTIPYNRKLSLLELHSNLLENETVHWNARCWCQSMSFWLPYDIFMLVFQCLANQKPINVGRVIKVVAGWQGGVAVRFVTGWEPTKRCPEVVLAVNSSLIGREF